MAGSAVCGKRPGLSLERLREREVYGDVWVGVRDRCWATDSLPGLLT